MKLRKKNSIVITIFLTAALVLSLSPAVFGAEKLSGNEILVKLDQKSQVVTQGEMLSILTFDDKKPDSPESRLRVGALARRLTDEPRLTLIYFLKPAYMEGSIFLSRDTEEEETKMWLYLSASQKKIQLSASRKEGRFFGTALSFEEIGSWSMSEEYSAESLEETTMEVGEESVSAYKLELTEKEGADPKFPKQTIWVGKDNWVLLQSKNYDDDGELKKEMKVKEMTTFEGNTVTKKLITTIVDTDHSTTVTYESRERPDQDIPDSVFDAENLEDFSPDKWGITE
ncbi:outer membrane lipoprotein-sorting protein [Candidatus Bipolaricaulota bacterium]|nr:outer membrane lipoprotein-sorting protein [Candidatus Bipolaricaulota bacterium]